MTESTTSSPHDAVFKTFMFTPETARDFLEIHLPEPLRKLCNLQTLRLGVEFYSNDAHKYLAALEKLGKLKGIVTQNIDGLHQKAGSVAVYEIHGSALRNYCMSCGKEYPEDYIFESKEPIPRCSCGGIIRPDITLYEEGLPDDQVDGAIKAISAAEMLIIGGTSLTVYPAASFINYFRGKYLVIINESEISVRAAENTLVIKEKIGKVFRELAGLQGISLE